VSKELEVRCDSIDACRFDNKWCFSDFL